MIWIGTDRDRLSQTVSLVPQTNGNIGPEASVTYTLRIYGEAGSLRRTYSGVISLQKHSIAFERAGYGLHYDKYYGGI